ncbi:hypothetical protein [Pukyongiella litopenaei]|uniref:Uncharacterized protein n=1 Tax=Pukyongiella litopenaei TaxID=2605946 RepID=A0A2S0MMH0_9RHOB|nr:hypothetical protein [Pukyongiella litopenaei]AVO37082.1 hypothetical protein C6Y53_04755 [Pukyongiella litopenaei]
MAMMPAISIATIATLVAAEICPWAEGSYEGGEPDFRAEFAVNQDCSQIVFQSSGSDAFAQTETPLSFPLTQTDNGWEADIHQIRTILRPDGRHIQFMGPGVDRLLPVNDH